jgi:hypothetical protein
MGNTIDVECFSNFCDVYHDFTAQDGRHCDEDAPLVSGCSPGIFYIRTYAHNWKAGSGFDQRHFLTGDKLKVQRLALVTQPLVDIECATTDGYGIPRPMQSATVDLLGNPRKDQGFSYLLNYGFTVNGDRSTDQQPIPGELILGTKGLYYIDASGQHPIDPSDVWLLIQHRRNPKITLAERKQAYLSSLERQSLIDPTIAKLQQPNLSISQALSQAQAQWQNYRLAFQGDAPFCLPKLRLTIQDQTLVVSPMNFWPLIDTESGIFAERELCRDTEIVDLLLPPGIEELVSLPLAQLFFTTLYQFRCPTQAELPPGEPRYLIRGLLLLSRNLGLRHYPEFYQSIYRAEVRTM